MILPKKQISLDESILGLGAFVLSHISDGKKADELWDEYRYAYNNNIYKVNFSFDQFILALDFLFIIGAIYKDEDNVIKHEVN